MFKSLRLTVFIPVSDMADMTMNRLSIYATEPCEESQKIRENTVQIARKYVQWKVRKERRAMNAETRLLAHWTGRDILIAVNRVILEEIGLLRPVVPSPRL